MIELILKASVSLSLSIAVFLWLPGSPLNAKYMLTEADTRLEFSAVFLSVSLSVFWKHKPSKNKMDQIYVVYHLVSQHPGLLIL